MKNYKEADEKICLGYTHLIDGKLKQAIDAWLSAWDLIKEIMTTEKIDDIFTLQEKYEWNEFLFNYVQELCEELYNLGLDNPQYLHKRIKYCEEFLDVTGNSEEMSEEEFRQAIAESHYALGNKKECDRLYETWLADDPTWGYGYFSWAGCYTFDEDNKTENLAKAEKIINQGLNTDNLRDRSDVIGRAIDIYTEMGEEEKVAALEIEFGKLTKTPVFSTTPITVNKTGRNDPCPCGSGKKHKKCCGK